MVCVLLPNGQGAVVPVVAFTVVTLTAAADATDEPDAEFCVCVVDFCVDFCELATELAFFVVWPGMQ